MFAYIDVVHLIFLLMQLFSLSVVYLIISKILPFKIEPRHEKTCLRGLPQGKTQTGPLSNWS